VNYGRSGISEDIGRLWVLAIKSKGASQHKNASLPPITTWLLKPSLKIYFLG
jgi:hypothetical protein